MPVVQVMLLYWNIVKESSPSVMSTTWKVFTCTGEEQARLNHFLISRKFCYNAYIEQTLYINGTVSQPPVSVDT